MSFPANFAEIQAVASPQVVCSGIATASNSYVAKNNIRGTTTTPPSDTANLRSTTPVFRVSIDRLVEWTKRHESRFSQLTALRAAGELGPQMASEWHQLQRERRRFKTKLSADEVLFQYQRRQHEANVLQELQRYVAFLETPRKAEA